jgi:hypothetical protein
MGLPKWLSYGFRFSGSRKFLQLSEGSDNGVSVGC